MTRPLSILVALILACGLASCSFHSAIDAQGNVIMQPSSQLMRSHGVKAFEKIKAEKQVSHDPKFTEPVQRVAERLKKVIDMPDADWEFVVFKDRSANAFALPGGKVGINTGLFKVVDSDELLAAVLGHEISHATAGHAQKRMTHAIVAIIAGAIIYQAMDHNEIDHAGEATAAYALALYLLDALPLSRRQEYESDRIGAIYMAKAGYDPRAAVKLWRKLDEYHRLQGEPRPEFLRTHPHDAARINALEAFIPTAMQYYRKHPKTGSRR
ncbi:M48 family metallopeptidase [Verrucomicrobiaceae bacterium 5K15]|uniref:M48 family metallopeptidase n=1 Tax=Oceaniferula flava TaxID=2800421 RepID=A0AAE2SB02_9BACT|nr:M48 family metallopeptidase [Oceaniferula flavus]MBK1853584.1 M48 family metallopeptidase [Oceaniferula flavus]MBM1134889.1 M48 family metallopeptidase [Oceaniferula flavus]